MRRQIVTRIILMYEGTINVRHRLQHILQRLAQIMAISQAHILIEHDIYLNVELVSRVIGLQALDLLDSLGESHGEVEQNVALISSGGSARQIADVAS